MGKRKISDEDVIKMRLEYISGKSIAQIARDYNLSYGAVYQIIRYKGIYKNIY